jgi:hypothetical protein
MPPVPNAHGEHLGPLADDHPDAETGAGSTQSAGAHCAPDGRRLPSEWEFL